MSIPPNEPFDQAMRRHQVNLNFMYPSLNSSGMLWFRDDDVEVGESMSSILTIYQPLFDARDYDLVNITLDSDDPMILSHIHPTVPTFLYQDFEKVHVLEKSLHNPEIYSETRKKHKKHAYKIKSNKNLRQQISEYHLPFSLTLDAFDEISHPGSTIRKHYRTIPVEVDSNIKQVCHLVFWKVMIEGETTHFAQSDESQNVFEDAQQRMSEAFAAMDVSGDGDNGEDPTTISTS